MKLDIGPESQYAEDMNKIKRNPFEVFEKTMKVVGRVLRWAFIIVMFGALLVAAPIAGILNGWSWDRTWAGWILVAVVVVTIAGMVPVLMGTAWVVNKWHSAKNKWERGNRGN